MVDPDAVRLGMCVLLGVVLSAAGCQPKTRVPLQVQAAAEGSPAINFEFSPVSALAEYVELPGEGAELTLIFTSYPRQCGRFVPPPTPEDAMVSVVVSFPLGVKPTTATYLWAGRATPDEAQAADAAAPEQPSAQPMVRRGARSYVMQPGGGLRVTGISLERDGLIRGILAFEFRGDAAHAASSVKGSFDAQFCRFKTLAEN